MSSDAIVLTIIAVVNLAVLVATLVLRSRPPKLPPPPPPHEPAALPLSAEDRDRLEKTAAAAFTKAVDEATARFGQDLAGTSDRLNKLIVHLTTEVVERELEQYHQSLAAARAQAIDGLSKMQQAIVAREQSVQADIDAELAKRRAFLLERIDHKLGAAVSAYVVDSLGQGADLGAQRQFLLDGLERHKEELKKEFADGV